MANNMDNKVKQVLFGSLLGDGCIANETIWVKSRFTETHSIKQKNYLFWKKNILKRQFAFGADGLDDKHISIRTRGYNIFTKLRKLFYLNGRKTVNKEILEQLDLLGLVVWYCDDGTYFFQNRNLNIYTYDFDYREHLLIQRFLKKKWAIDCKLCFDSRKKWYINLNGANAKKFLRLINPIFEHYDIPRCMHYKLGHLWNGNRRRIESAREVHRRDYNRWYQQPKIKERKRIYYQRNRNKILRQRKKHYQRIKETEKYKRYIRQYSKQYRHKNRERINAYKRKWRRKRKLKNLSAS